MWKSRLQAALCDRVGIKSPKIIIGSQLDKLSDIAVLLSVQPFIRFEYPNDK